MNHKGHLVGEPKTAGVFTLCQYHSHWDHQPTPAVRGSPNRWHFWSMALSEQADNPGVDDTTVAVNSQVTFWATTLKPRNQPVYTTLQTPWLV